MLLIENFLNDSNNFQTGSWSQVSIAANSYNAVAPDNNLRAYNFVDSNTGAAGYVEQNFAYTSISSLHLDLRFGVFVKKTGVGSLSSVSLDVRSANTSNFVTLVWSGQNAAVYSGSALVRKLTEVYSGWYHLEMTVPNSGYASTIRTRLYAASTVAGAQGACAYYMPYLTLANKIAYLNAEYDFKGKGKKIESEHRTRSGRNYIYKWGEYDEVSFTAKYVDRLTKDIVNSWWQNNDQLLLIDEYGTKVMSCQLMNNTAILDTAIKPYNNLFSGIIELGTY